MNRNRRGHIVLIISIMLLFIGLIMLLIFESSGRLVPLVATLTTIIGLFSIYIQMRKSKLVGQTSFTIEISKYLYELSELPAFIHKLGRASDIDDEAYIIQDSDRPMLIKYLNYIKTVAALVKEKTVTIETLNKVFAYEFYIIVNNESVQKKELQPFSLFYEDIFWLYYQWTEYLVNHKQSILHEEYSLSKLPEYKKYVERYFR